MLGVAWSLEVEVQFYLLMPLLALIFLVRQSWLRRGILCAAIIAAPPDGDQGERDRDQLSTGSTRLDANGDAPSHRTTSTRRPLRPSGFVAFRGDVGGNGSSATSVEVSALDEMFLNCAAGAHDDPREQPHHPVSGDIDMWRARRTVRDRNS